MASASLCTIQDHKPHRTHEEHSSKDSHLKSVPKALPFRILDILISRSANRYDVVLSCPGLNRLPAVVLYVEGEVVSETSAHGSLQDLVIHETLARNDEGVDGLSAALDHVVILLQRLH